MGHINILSVLIFIRATCWHITMNRKKKRQLKKLGWDRLYVDEPFKPPRDEKVQNSDVLIVGEDVSTVDCAELA